MLVDVDKDGETAKKYGVQAMPTLIVADKDEKVLVKQVGAQAHQVAVPRPDATLAAIATAAGTR